MSLLPYDWDLAAQLEEDRQLQLEEEYLRAALKKIRRQLHSLRVERLYLESLKAKWEDLENQLNDDELEQLEEAVNSDDPPEEREADGEYQDEDAEMDIEFINQEQHEGDANPGVGGNNGDMDTANPK